MIGHNDAKKDENGSRKSDGSEGFVKHQNGAEQRDQRLCVHIVAGANDIKFAQHHVPRKEAAEAGHYAEKDEVGPHHGL